MDSLDTNTETDNPRAVIGGNNPPDPIEMLLSDLTLANISVVARKDELTAGIGRFPEKIEDDETSGKAGDFILQVRKLIEEIESSRVTAKEPHLNAGRAVDAFFKKLSEPVAALLATIKPRNDAYVIKKQDEERARIAEAQRIEQARLAAAQAETETNPLGIGEPLAPARMAAPAPTTVAPVRGSYGSASSTRESWDFEITDAKSIPLASLRPYLKREHLEQAIRAYVAAYKDTKPLKGVSIFKKRSVVTR